MPVPARVVTSEVTNNSTQEKTKEIRMKWKRAHRWAAIMVVALLVAACGSGEGSSSTEPASEPTTTGAPGTTAAPATTTAGETYKLGLITKFPVDFSSSLKMQQKPGRRTIPMSSLSPAWASQDPTTKA
ncbi:MAG TPA: hypothetical protein VI193_11140 [Acidimicrobiia bacterium]